MCVIAILEVFVQELDSSMEKWLPEEKVWPIMNDGDSSAFSRGSGAISRYTLVLPWRRSTKMLWKKPQKFSDSLTASSLFPLNPCPSFLLNWAVSQDSEYSEFEHVHSLLWNDSWKFSTRNPDFWASGAAFQPQKSLPILTHFLPNYFFCGAVLASYLLPTLWIGRASLVSPAATLFSPIFWSFFTMGWGILHYLSQLLKSEKQPLVLLLLLRHLVSSLKKDSFL